MLSIWRRPEIARKRERDAALLVSWGLAGKLVSAHTTSGIAGMNKEKELGLAGFKGCLQEETKQECSTRKKGRKGPSWSLQDSSRGHHEQIQPLQQSLP